MSYVTIGMIALTAIALIFGTLFGMGRGCNRSILRLILLVGCVVGAIFLRQMVTDIIMGIDTGEGTVEEMLSSMLNSEEQPLPQSMQKLVAAMIEIIFGLVSYFLVFFVLRFITWVLIYPILKIFVKKEAKKKRGFGALIGLVQGVVTAFAVLVPLNGLAVEVNKLSKVEMSGKPMLAIPAEVGLDEYAESVPNTIYNSVGGWYYQMLTTAETEKGEKFTLSGTCDVLLSMADVGNSLNKVKLGTETLRKAGATDQEKYDSLHSAAQGLKDSAEKINKLDSDSKKLLDDILIETLSGENVQKITLEYINFDSAAQFFESFAEYVKKTKINPEAVSQEEVNKIVNGFAGSGFLVDMFIGDGMSPVATLYKVETEDYLKFANAINSNTDLSILQKAALLTVFGVSI